MFCRFCGQEIGEEEQFCPHCGKDQGVALSADLAQKGRKLTRLKLPGETKNPGAAASLGFFLGWIFLGPVGYIYLEQWNWFWLTFILQLFVIPLTLGLAYIIIPVIFAFHQYQMAKEINERVMAQRNGEDARDEDAAGQDRDDLEDEEEF